MKYNLSFVDIVARYTMILICGILFGLTQWFFLIPIAVLLFMTAVLGWCPVYFVLGRSTIQKEEQE